MLCLADFMMVLVVLLGGMIAIICAGFIGAELIIRLHAWWVLRKFDPSDPTQRHSYRVMHHKLLGRWPVDKS